MTSPGETILCHYRYDPLDRLINHTLPDIPERQRFYCKSRLATEIQGAMRYSIVQHGDQLLAQRRSEGDAPATTLLATDQQRSVLQTVEVNHPTPPIAYTPYGHRTGESGLLSLLGFNGERPDLVTGRYLLGNGYRAFNPVLMRFNSPDSLSPFGKGGANSYLYCLGEPILGSDPTGHFNIFKWGRNAVRSLLNNTSRSARANPATVTAPRNSLINTPASPALSTASTPSTPSTPPPPYSPSSSASFSSTDTMVGWNPLRRNPPPTYSEVMDPPPFGHYMDPVDKNSFAKIRALNERDDRLAQLNKVISMRREHIASSPRWRSTETIYLPTAIMEGHLTALPVASSSRSTSNLAFNANIIRKDY
jgi:RHS repeat-associated protein